MMYGFTVNLDGNVVAAMKQIEEQLAAMGMKATVEVHKTEAAFTGMGEKLKETFGGLKSMLLGGLGIAALFEGVEFIKDSKEGFDKLEESTMKINAALASTKGIAGETAEELEKIAKASSGKVLFGRAAIEDAESMLLTFTQIRGEIYEKTIPAVEDFATRFKKDLPEAANMLGKALNDPLKGMTRLQREGVVFSETQKETIKNFMATGQLAEAQGVILNELSTEFGGLAEAMTKTDEGKIAMAKKGWADIKLEIGEVVSKIQVALIPLLGLFQKMLRGLVDIFKSDSVAAVIFKDALLAISAVVLIYYANMAAAIAITKAVTIAQWAWNAAMAANPIVWLIALIVGIVVALAVLWDKFKGFREFMGGFFGFMKNGVMTLVHLFVYLGIVIGDIFSFKFKKAIQDGKNAFKQLEYDVSQGMTNAINAGADAAGKSQFKFNNLISPNFGQEQGKGVGNGKGGPLGSAVKDSAINTSNLGGASGGLGQAKVINIKIDTVQKNYEVEGKDLKSKGKDAVDIMLRTINNLSLSQGGTQ